MYLHLVARETLGKKFRDKGNAKGRDGSLVGIEVLRVGPGPPAGRLV